MTLILPGIYSVGKLQSCKLVQNEIYALQKLATVTNDVITFNKLYCKETMLYSTCYGGNSSICSALASHVGHVFRVMQVQYVQVFSDPLPLVAVPIHLLCSKCVQISFPDSNYCYRVNIPNNFEHHP